MSKQKGEDYIDYIKRERERERGTIESRCKIKNGEIWVVARRKREYHEMIKIFRIENTNLLVQTDCFILQ